jgi:hypothetical protein
MNYDQTLGTKGAANRALTGEAKAIRTNQSVRAGIPKLDN